MPLTEAHTGYLVTAPNLNRDDYDRVMNELDGELSDGTVTHFAGEVVTEGHTPSGLIIASIVEDPKAEDAFQRERLGPAVERAGAREKLETATMVVFDANVMRGDRPIKPGDTGFAFDYKDEPGERYEEIMEYLRLDGIIPEGATFHAGGAVREQRTFIGQQAPRQGMATVDIWHDPKLAEPFYTIKLDGVLFQNGVRPVEPTQFVVAHAQGARRAR